MSYSKAEPGTEREDEVRLDVAGVVLALRGGGVRRTVLGAPQYPPFVSGAPSVATVEVETAEVNAVWTLPGPELKLEGESLSFGTFGGEAYLDAGTGSGWLRVAADDHVALGALANFLRVAYALLLIRHGGFLFHSAGMIRDGRGYVFYGHSGSGKSTITRLSREQATLLSDDLVALRDYDGAWRVHGTPFWGELRNYPRTAASAPLRGLFSLVKANDVALEPLPRGLAAADVVSSVPVTSTEPRLSTRLIDLCADLVARVPCYRLYFPRNDSFWRVIDELA